MFNAVPAEGGITEDALGAAVGAKLVQVGMQQAMKKKPKWLNVEVSTVPATEEGKKPTKVKTFSRAVSHRVPCFPPDCARAGHPALRLLNPRCALLLPTTPLVTTSLAHSLLTFAFRAHLRRSPGARNHGRAAGSVRVLLWRRR